jgi:hypothetical protein
MLASPPARVCAVRGRGAGRLDVGELLHRVQSAAPVDSVPAVAAALAEMVDAREVNLLITDFSGRAVVWLTSTDPVEGARSRGVEQAETLPLSGTVYERVLRTQRVDVRRVDEGARLALPRFPSVREVVHALGAAVLRATGGNLRGRRDDALPRLVRRAAPRPEHRTGRRPLPRLAERLTATPGFDR